MGAKKKTKGITITLVPCKADDVPPEPEVAAAKRKAFPKDAYVHEVGGRVVGMIGDGVDRDLGWIKDGKLTKVRMPSYASYDVRDDGKTALFIDNNERLIREVDFETKKVKTLVQIESPWEPVGVGYGPADTFAVLNAEELGLYRGGKTAVQIDKKKCAGHSLSVFERKIAIVLTLGNAAIICELTKDKIVHHETLKKKAHATYAVGRRIFLTDFAKYDELKGLPF